MWADARVAADLCGGWRSCLGSPPISPGHFALPFPAPAVETQVGVSTPLSAGVLTGGGAGENSEITLKGTLRTGQTIESKLGRYPFSQEVDEAKDPGYVFSLLSFPFLQEAG